MNNIVKLLVLLLIAAALILPSCSSPAPAPTPATPTPSTPSAPPTTPITKGGSTMQWSSPPPLTIDQNKQYTATIKTNFGTMTAQLYPKDAPNTVNNFVFLSRQGFYNGVVIHRIVKGFVFQGGDPTGTGSGGPGYKFADEKITKDYAEGTLAMANSGPNTNGSQFFVCLTNLSGRLPKNYTIFGQITDGMDIVKKIGEAPVTSSRSGEASSPTGDVHIDSITIEEK
jgi:cyclophilin family peptidyl-prolyl cis-trans isomerase